MKRLKDVVEQHCIVKMNLHVVMVKHTIHKMLYVVETKSVIKRMAHVVVKKISLITHTKLYVVTERYVCDSMAQRNAAEGKLTKMKHRCVVMIEFIIGVQI